MFRNRKLLRNVPQKNSMVFVFITHNYFSYLNNYFKIWKQYFCSQQYSFWYFLFRSSFHEIVKPLPCMFFFFRNCLKLFFRLDNSERFLGSVISILKSSDTSVVNDNDAEWEKYFYLKAIS